MNNLEKTQIQLGYIPLLDCVALLWAKHREYFDEVGLDVTLVKEASWASLRDRLCFGALDLAHCLSAILPATSLEDNQFGIQLMTPLTLSVNRAFISLSQPLCYELNITHTDPAAQSAHKICEAISTGKNIQFAHVFKHSIHHYCLREWLALANTDIAKNIKLNALPPPYMVDAIRNHRIDGFCVGEPWNTQAELEGYSHIISSSQNIIPAIADKVLAVTKEWALNNPNSLDALLSAIKKSQHELTQLEDLSEVWQLLVDFNIIRFHCSKNVHTLKYYQIQNIIRNFVPENSAPKTSDFIWIMQQMNKWDNLNIDRLDQHAEEFVYR